jgi:thiol-disulfide isomerase/thioredoxin
MKNRRWAWVLVVLSCFLIECIGAEEIETLQIGAEAPDFRLPGIDGRDYQLSDFADSKLLVVLFTCNHCPTAQAYEERIIQLVEDYGDRGVSFVGISPNDPQSVRLDELGYSDVSDSFEEMKLRAEEKGFNFPYLYDGNTQTASKKYGPTATPHVFLFDPDRILRYRGRIDDSENGENIQSRDLSNALESLLAGTEVSVKTTRPFGCSIKWADKRDSVTRAQEKWAAEEVSLESVDTKALREIIANGSDNLRLVNLWATWCGPCIVEFPELVDINRMYRNRNFEFISVSADDPDQAEEVLAFLRKQQASNRNVHFNSLDRDALVDSIDPDWSGALPYSLLIKPGGEVIFRHTGEVNPLELKRAIVGYLGRTY